MTAFRTFLSPATCVDSRAPLQINKRIERSNGAIIYFANRKWTRQLSRRLRIRVTYFSLPLLAAFSRFRTYCSALLEDPEFNNNSHKTLSSQRRSLGNCRPRMDLRIRLLSTLSSILARDLINARSKTCYIVVHFLFPTFRTSTAS